jgi:hypothetical protein
MIKYIYHRIYEDYFMPSRMEEYRRLIEQSLQAGYQHCTLSEYYRLLKNNSLKGTYFLHRHDIDTDPETAFRFFEIERRYGIRSSYYFRLSTLDVDLMHRINDGGGEVGYHYEELATYCKRKRLNHPLQVLPHYEAIRREFKANLNSVRAACRFPISSIASHGDFANRKLGIPNHAFITQTLMDESGVEFECYNPLLTESYSIACSDSMYPLAYKPVSPFDAIARGEKVIYLLTHPRHWHRAPVWNTLESIRRIKEGILFR